MKNIKIFYLTLVAIIAGLFTACENKDFEAGPTVDGMQVYFPTTVPASYYLGEDENSVTIPVKRIVTDEAAAINILGSDESELFDIPSSVSFAAGEDTASLKITFDRSKLVDGMEYPVSLLINDENNTTPYGESSLSIIIAPWPWILEGEGLFRDDWLTSMFRGDASANIPVNIHRHKTREGIYMIEDMYGWNFLEPFFGASQSAIEAQVVRYTPTNITINCSDPNGVFIPRQFSGITDIDSDYGDYEIATLQDGLGKLEDGIITFPQRGLALFCLQGGQYANTSGMFRIVFPGIEIADYSLAAEYDGMKVEADGTTTSAYVNFTYGDDATGFHYTVASGNLGDDDIEAAVAAIVDGTNEDVVKVTELAEEGNTVTEKFALPSGGIYTLVAVALDKEGKPTVKGTASIKFYFPGAGGGTAPECELAARMGLVSEYWAEMSEQLPDSSSLYFEIAGSELKSVFIYIDTTDTINSYKAIGYSEEVIVDALGSDFSERVVPSINANGFYGSAWINRRSDTSYTMIVKATNIYDNSKVVSATYSTTAIPYSGDLAIGNYVMHFDAPANDGTTIPCDNYIKIVPQEEGNNTDFFVFDFGLEVEVNSWYAKYDAAASTLTLSGVIQGFESYGNMFGGWIAFSETEAERIVSFDAADENSQGTDPVVIKVDSATKQLATIDNDIIIYLGSVSGNSISNSQLVALYYADGTTLTKESAAAAATPKSLGKKSRSSKVPFSSVRVPADTQMTVAFEKKAFANTATVSKSNKVRTISINATKCEPLHKAFDRRDAKNGGILLEATK